VTIGASQRGSTSERSEHPSEPDASSQYSGPAGRVRPAYSRWLFSGLRPEHCTTGDSSTIAVASAASHDNRDRREPHEAHHHEDDDDSRWEQGARGGAADRRLDPAVGDCGDERLLNDVLTTRVLLLGRGEEAECLTELADRVLLSQRSRTALLQHGVASGSRYRRKGNCAGKDGETAAQNSQSASWVAGRSLIP
jgi:hypothetical protein